MPLSDVTMMMVLLELARALERLDDAPEIAIEPLDFEVVVEQDRCGPPAVSGRKPGT